MSSSLFIWAAALYDFAFASEAQNFSTRLLNTPAIIPSPALPVSEGEGKCDHFYRDLPICTAYSKTSFGHDGPNGRCIPAQQIIRIKRQRSSPDLQWMRGLQMAGHDMTQIQRIACCQVYRTAWA